MSPGSSTPSNCFARNFCPSAAMMSRQHRKRPVLAGCGFVVLNVQTKKGLHDKKHQEVYFNHQWLFYSTLCYATLFYSSPCTPSKTSVTWSFSRKFPIQKGLSSIAVMNFRVGHQTLLPFVVLIFQELPTLYPSFWTSFLQIGLLKLWWLLWGQLCNTPSREVSPCKRGSVLVPYEAPSDEDQKHTAKAWNLFFQGIQVKSGIGINPLMGICNHKS